MLRTSRRRGARRRLAGSVFLWCVVIALPISFFSSSLTVDLSRIYLAHREMTNAALSAAQSGAEQIAYDTSTLSSTASSVAAQTLALEVSSQAAPGDTTIVAQHITTTSTTVTVKVTYKVNGMIFAPIFNPHAANKTYSVSVSAFVCVPGASTNPTNGYCAAPLYSTG